jgi:transcriptional regulator with XRE-family HTH domain
VPVKLQIRGGELRRRRLEKYMSQEELASRAGLSSQAVSMLERGADGVRPSTVRALAKALGCSREDISEVVQEVTA